VPLSPFLGNCRLGLGHLQIQQEAPSLDSKCWNICRGAPTFRDFRMCGRKESVRVKHGSADTNHFPLVPKPGMSGAPGPELTPDSQRILYWASPPTKGSSPAGQRLMRFPVSGGSPEQVLQSRIDDAAGFHCPASPAGSCVLGRITCEMVLRQRSDQPSSAN
jgi:hypothetical protein